MDAIAPISAPAVEPASDEQTRIALAQAGNDAAFSALAARHAAGLHRFCCRLIAGAAGRLAIGHNDWSAKHFRFVGSAVRVIYDWDSVRAEPEPVLAGRAAQNFTMTYGTPWEGRVPMAPTLDELHAFIADYETTRGTPFSAAERRTACAAAVYSMAYTSPCGHDLDPRDGPTAAFPPGSYREALATYGETLLADPSS